MGREEVTDITVWVTRIFILILLSQEHFGGKGLVGWTLDSNLGSATGQISIFPCTWTEGNRFFQTLRITHIKK